MALLAVGHPSRAGSTGRDVSVSNHASDSEVDGGAAACMKTTADGQLESTHREENE